ncbi:zinc finger protein RFP-like isoform X2 [Rhineura floridana]|uniref:zinc finger protein RFP-like isoform X2 n=1 Tax=Rhineura floridana TaxID=261503 RepID=UPI002AC7EE9E|nr:zinc finger protein RFP-like isoform X2 [Rhineura floridana]
MSPFSEERWSRTGTSKTVYPSLTQSQESNLPVVKCNQKRNQGCCFAEREREAAMAAEHPEKDLCEEVTCSICLEYFRDPVTTDCDHNFCRGCLKRCWGRANGRLASCPQCRATIKHKNLRRNQKLANIVEIIRKIEEEKNVEDKAGVCREPMKLFCKDDQALICVVCNRSKDHRDHDVVPVEEAAREYKEKIQAQMQPLQKKRENIVQRKLVEEQKKQKCLTQVGAEKHGVRFAFKQMQKFLKENERRWLAQLEDLQREIEKRWKDNVTSLSEESSCLGGLIAEMEGKCQQPASEFLQDIKCTLSRCQEGQLRKVVEIFSGPEEGLRSYSQKSLVLKKVMEKFEESLEEALNKGPLKETRSKDCPPFGADTVGVCGCLRDQRSLHLRLRQSRNSRGKR